MKDFENLKKIYFEQLEITSSKTMLNHARSCTNCRAYYKVLHARFNIVSDCYAVAGILQSSKNLFLTFRGIHFRFSKSAQEPASGDRRQEDSSSTLKRRLEEYVITHSVHAAYLENR